MFCDNKKTTKKLAEILPVTRLKGDGHLLYNFI